MQIMTMMRLFLSCVFLFNTTRTVCNGLRLRSLTAAAAVFEHERGKDLFRRRLRFVTLLRGGGNVNNKDDDDDDDDNNNNNDALGNVLDYHSDDESENEEEEEESTVEDTQEHNKKRSLHSSGGPFFLSRLTRLLHVRQRDNMLLILILAFVFRKQIVTALSTVQTRIESWDSTTLFLRLALAILLLQSAWRANNANNNTNKNNNDDSSEQRQQQLSLFALLLAQAAGVPPIVVLAWKLLLLPATMTNTAFVPPIQQHYSFEVYNQRYSKDAKALEKVLKVPLLRNVKVEQSNDNVTTKTNNDNSSSANVSWLANIIIRKSTPKTTARMTKQATSNTTDGENDNQQVVIVLEMTKLDTSLSQLDTIRDKVSFLLSQQRKRAMTTIDATLVPNQKHASNNPTPSSTSNTAVQGGNDVKSSAKTLELTQAVVPLEVVVLLESPGGSAADYALAAQQLLRLKRAPNIALTVIVDKVAASGGYMIACTADTLLAAPFAVLGSIGVVGQTLNFYQTLQTYGIESLTFRSGRHKAPLTATDKVTREGMAVVQSMLDDVHRAFQAHVATVRPALAANMDQVATGETWLGYDALKRGLIDGIMTSDEYLQEKMDNGARVLKLVQIKQPKYSMFGPSVTSTTGYETCSSNPCGLLNQCRLLVTNLVQKVNLLLGQGTTAPFAQAKL